MESLNIRIKEGINRYSNMNSGENSEFMKNLKIQKENLYTEFKIWLDNLKISMHHCKYRQVIAEIESKKIILYYVQSIIGNINILKLMQSLNY